MQARVSLWNLVLDGGLANFTGRVTFDGEGHHVK